MTLSRFLISILFLIVSQTGIYAQTHERDNWYFGVHAGLKFTSNSVTVINDGQTTEVNATASISDENGNLLFYTDANRIWNRKHQIMENGDLLDGYDGNYSQQVVIVKHPGQVSQYYVFYVSEINYPTHLHRLKYSVVNISNGDGVVESKNTMLTSEDILVKITSIEDIGKGFWVITQGDGTGKYFAFHGTQSGVDATPVVTDVGIATRNSFDYGDLKFSPGGKILVAANWSSQRLSLFRFDFGTGLLLDPLFITADSPISVEFDSEAKFMYVASVLSCSTNILYQYDVSLYSQSSITTSRLTIGSAPNIGMLQRGPDGKIYVGRRDPGNCNQYPYVGTIGAPNMRGSASLFNPQSIHLQSGTTFQGLPNFSTIFCSDNITIPSEVVICNESSYTFDLSGSSAQFIWEDGSTKPVRKITQSAVYSVQSTLGSCRESDQSKVNFHNDTIRFADDTLFTFKFPVTLAPVSKKMPENITWQDNSNTSVYNAKAPGEYSFTALIDGCSYRDSIIVSAREVFVPNVITVNADNKNDFFILPFIKPGEYWQVRIYNRYGMQLFSDPNYQNTWQTDLSQICFYHITNHDYGINIKGILHVVN